MAVNQAISIPQGNTLDLSMQITLPPQPGYNTAEPYPLTGLTLAMVVKPSATSPDADGATYTPSVTSAAEGLATVTVPGADNNAAGSQWYRIDVIDESGNHTTASYGPYQILAV